MTVTNTITPDQKRRIKLARDKKLLQRAINTRSCRICSGVIDQYELCLAFDRRGSVCQRCSGAISLAGGNIENNEGFGTMWNKPVSTEKLRQFVKDGLDKMENDMERIYNKNAGKQHETNNGEDKKKMRRKSMS